MSNRRLSLHASALNDDEYNHYTRALKELAEIEDGQGNQGGDGDDEYYEGITLGVREVRAWLRGRYSDIPSNEVDNILKMFSPSLAHADTLSGGQVFAVLRLVAHVRSGKELDRSLAFVQARPPQSTSSRPASPSKRPAPIPPRRSFTSLSEHPQPPQHPSASSSTRGSSTKPAPPPPISVRSEDGGRHHRAPSPSKATLPPLPPRKSAPANQATFLPPPKHSSSAHDAQAQSHPGYSQHHASQSHSHSLSQSQPQHQVGHSQSPAPTYSSQGYNHPPAREHRAPPQLPPKPGGHVTSTLMKQSLQASKVAQTMKKAEEQLEKERIMQVLKSSNTSASMVAGSPFRAAPPPPSSHTKPPAFPSPFTNAPRPAPRPTTNRDTSPPPRQPPPQPPARSFPVAPSVSSSSASDLDARSTTSSNRLPPRPFPHTINHRKSSVSVSSLEQVALAVPRAIEGSRSSPGSRDQSRVGTRTRHVSTPGEGYTQSPLGSPARANAELPPAPPMHPDRTRKPPPLPALASAGSSASFDAVYGGSSAPASSTTGVFATPLGSPTSAVSTTSVEPSPTTTRGRVWRSQSMHQTGSPLLHGESESPFGGGSSSREPPAVPQRKKRPESMQVGWMGRGDDGTSVDRDPFASPGEEVNSTWKPLSRHVSLGRGGGRGGGVHRRSSLSVTSPTTTPAQSTLLHASNSHSYTGYPTPNASPLNMKTMLSTLTAQSRTKTEALGERISERLEAMKPGLEKAVYKAEAGLNVRRGYVATPGHHRHHSREGRREEKEGLMRSDGDDDGAGVDDGCDDASEESFGARGRERERDELKWPVAPGEGWKPL